MNRRLSLSAVALALCMAMSAHAQTDRRNATTVLGQPLPTSLTTVITRSVVTLKMAYFANTDTADHTILVQDCQGTPFKPVPTITIPASTAVNIPLPAVGIPLSGCLKWQADSATVQGTLYAE